QHPADLQLWVMAQYQANQAVRDHSRARNTYSFSNCIVHHGIPSLLPKRALINKMAPVHTSGQAGGKRLLSLAVQPERNTARRRAGRGVRQLVQVSNHMAQLVPPRFGPDTEDLFDPATVEH